MRRIVLFIGLLFIMLNLITGCGRFKYEELSGQKRLELAEKCSKAGMAYFNDFFLHSLPYGFSYDEPEYHYSRNLNTCLIHIRYFKLSTKTSLQCNQVKDLFSNKPILYGWFRRDLEKNTETLTDPPTGGIPNYTSAEYFKQKDKLFSE